MYDTIWLTLPVETWQRLFERANQSDRTASDYVRILIERGTLPEDWDTSHSIFDKKHLQEAQA